VQQGGSSQQPPPGPTKVYESKVAVANPPAQADLIQVLLDFSPGAWTPPHTHGGQTLNTVLEGEITVRENGADKTLKPGEMWSDTPDQVHAAGNAGTTKASLAVAFLLPKGAQLTIVQSAAPAAAPATLPKTGEADQRALSNWLVLVVVIGLIGSGWVLRRLRRQHD
jgi:quercetin dioxygenase-like cupin family protein